MDVGGIEIFAPDTTSLYQEGAMLPATKVVKRGVVDQETIDIIGFNCRFRDLCIGDLYAMIAACEAGKRGCAPKK